MTMKIDVKNWNNEVVGAVVGLEGAVDAEARPGGPQGPEGRVLFRAAAAT